MRSLKKKRIALFAMGVIGGGSLSQGIPVLENLFTRLSAEYEIVYYCFQPIDPSRVPAPIQVRSAGSRLLPGRLNFALLFFRFCMDHLGNRFSTVFSVSVYPTGWAAAWAGRLFGVPSIVQIIALEAVALPDIGAGNLLRPWLKKLTQKVFDHATHVIAVAEYQKTIAENSLRITRPISVLPLRIDHNNFTYRARGPATPLELIHIAFYGRVKDQHCLFKAFAEVLKHKPARLTVVGDGYSLPELDVFLRKLGILDQIRFTGPVRQSEIPLLLDRSDMLVHPARFETGCAVIQEAMASGVAVVGTRVGLLADIGDEFAGVVEVSDYIALANKILEVSGNPELYARLTSNAYRMISKYDAQWMVKGYKEFLDAVIAGEAARVTRAP